MKKLRIALVLGLLAWLTSVPAKADYVIKDGNGNFQTVLSFLCQSFKICPAQVSIDSTGAEKAIQANPSTTGDAHAEVCVVPTVTSGSAYTTGNVVGGLLAFSSGVRSQYLAGIIQSVRLETNTVQTAEFDVTFFQAQPAASTWTDKTAPSIQTTDKVLVYPPVKLTNNYSGLGTHTVYGADSINRSVHLGATTLYSVITVVGTPTFGSTTDLQLCVTLKQD